MARRAMVEILGSAAGFKRATNESIHAANQLGHGLKRLGVDANASARAQVAASERKTSRLRHEITAYKQIAASARRGSHEQVAAAQLAAKAEQRLSRSLGVTAREQRALTLSASRAEHTLSRGARGALAGSGAFRSMGRSLAFASGAFIGIAGVSSFLRSSIDAGVEAAATQKQLAAQFKASGLSLKPYRKEIDETTARLSSLSGFTRDDLTKSFTTAFRGTKDVTSSLRLESVAADAARGSHKELSTVTLALTKGILGQTGGLRRLGILVPKTAKGMEVLNFVGRKFAGQAQAGTTAQQRFSAELHNSQVIIGTALLPTLTHLLTHGAAWLSQMNRSGKLQRDVNRIVRTTGQALRGLAQAFRLARAAVSPFVHLVGGAKHAAMVAGVAFLLLKIRTQALNYQFQVANAEALGLRNRMVGLSKIGKITIAIAFATEAYGPMKKFFEQHFGADFRGLSKKGDIVAGVKTGSRAQRAKNVAEQARAAGLSSPQIERVLRQRGFSSAEITGALSQQSGEDVGLRGSGSRQPIGVSSGGGGDARSGRLGLKGQFGKLELQLAQAQLTATQKDDKAVLEKQASNLRARIATGKGSLADRTALNQQLGGVLDQIRSLDKTTADKEKTANEHKLSLKKKQAAAEKAHLAKLRAQFKADTAAMNQAIDTARGQFGELGQGSVLNPSEEQRKRALGVPGHTVGQYTADLRSQNVDFRARQRDINKLRRRHAPSRLLTELIAQGDAGAEELHALAGAKGPAYHQFLAQYKQREKAVRQAARDAAPKVFVNVTLDGKKIAEAVTVRQERAGRHKAKSRSGR